MYHLTKNPDSGTYSIWEIFVVPDKEVLPCYKEGSLRFSDRLGTVCTRKIDTVVRGSHVLGDIEELFTVLHVRAYTIFQSEDMEEVIGIAALEQCDAEGTKSLDVASDGILRDII